MSQESFLPRRKDYFRRSDTALAMFLERLGGGYRGEAWTQSKRRRILHFGMRAVLALAAQPTIAEWKRKIKKAGYDPIYEQERLSGIAGYDENGEPIFETYKVKKLRSMIPNADSMFTTEEIVRINLEQGEDADPRLIPEIGAEIRRSKEDELPQISSDLSIIGPRSIPLGFLAELKKQMSQERYELWLKAYLAGGGKISGGVIPPVAVLDRNNKNDLLAALVGIHYARKASLNYDLLIFYKAIEPSIAERLEKLIPIKKAGAERAQNRAA